MYRNHNILFQTYKNTSLLTPPIAGDAPSAAPRISLRPTPSKPFLTDSMVRTSRNRQNLSQTYTINTFLTHRWVVMLNGAEVQTWVISERQAKQTFVLSKASLA